MARKPAGVTFRVLLTAVTVTALTPAGPVGATTTTYSAPLRTAVRQLPVAAENTSAYARNRYFGGWIDADRECQDARHEVLIAEGTGVTLNASGCTVASGGGFWWSAQQLAELA